MKMFCSCMCSHESAATQWLDPRLESKQKQELLECDDDGKCTNWMFDVSNKDEAASNYCF